MTDPLGLINAGQAGPMKGAGGTSPVQGVEAADGPGFKDVLMKNIEQVNQLQQDAEMAVEDLMTGKRDDYTTVMIAKRCPSWAAASAPIV